MKKRLHDGFRKFCGHPRREWARCGCPWHFSFRASGSASTSSSTSRPAMRWVGPRPRDSVTNCARIIRATEVPSAQGRAVRLEEKPIAAVAKADVEAVRDARRAFLAE